MIGEFCEKIAILCFVHQGSVTSWIRTESRNNDVGGHWKSRHLFGLAVDVVLDSTDNTASFITECERYGLKAIDEGDYIHVQSN